MAGPRWRAERGPACHKPAAACAAQGPLALYRGVTAAVARGMLYGGLRIGLYTPLKKASMQRMEAGRAAGLQGQQASHACGSLGGQRAGLPSERDWQGARR